MSFAPLTSISAEEFDRLTFDSPVPVMVFLGAERCTVCKELLPVVEEIAYDYAARMNFFRVDVDLHKTLSTRLRLKGIPQLLFFNNGEIKERMGGLNAREDIITVIHRVLGVDQ